MASHHGLDGEGGENLVYERGFVISIMINDAPMVAFGGQTLLLSASNSGSHRRRHAAGGCAQRPTWC